VINQPVGEMIKDQVLLALPPATTVRAASERMRERYVGSVVVTDEAGRLLGIFTERDAVCRVLAAGRDAERTTLAEVMTAKPGFVGPDAMPIEALRLMQDGGFRHVPVVLRDGRVVGMVSFTDFRGLDFARLQARLEEEGGYFESLR
jgi:CBS domain-containing protein